MEDHLILDLYWNRDENAIRETDRKYGAHCRQIAQSILKNRQDVEECINDTWLRAWNAIPPQRPFVLRTYLGKITRNLALSTWEKNRAQKRGGGQVPAVLEELEACVSDSPEFRMEEADLSRLLDRFVRSLPEKERCVFVRRYWYLDSVAEIGHRYHMASGSVKSSLYRSREKLRKCLEREGIIV